MPIEIKKREEIIHHGWMFCALLWMICQGDEIRCEYDGCKLGEGSGWNPRICNSRRPRGKGSTPEAFTRNMNVGLLPTWPILIGPSCHNSNALTPPRPELVWFSLVHSSPSRLAPLTASTRTKFKFLLSICDLFFKILSQFHGWLAAQSTFCLLATNPNDRRSQLVTGGWSWVVGLGEEIIAQSSLSHLVRGRWSWRCSEGYVRCFFVSGRCWSQSEVHIKVMSFIAWQGWGVCKWMLWRKFVSSGSLARVDHPGSGFVETVQETFFSQRSRTDDYSSSVLCDDDDDLCSRVVGRVRGLQVDSSLDVRVWSLIASKSRNKLKSGLYPSRDLTASIFGSLQKKEPRVYLRHQRICIWVRASVPCVSSLTTQAGSLILMMKFGCGYGASSRYISMCTYGVGAWGNLSACLPHRQWSQCKSSLCILILGMFQVSPGPIRIPRRWYWCATISVFWARKCSHHPLLQWGSQQLKGFLLTPFSLSPLVLPITHFLPLLSLLLLLL